MMKQQNQTKDPSKKKGALLPRVKGPSPMGLPLGLPRTLRTRLRYCDSVTINPASMSTGFYYFRANSLFDPDYSSTGHQPMGFDQLAVLYDHYVVTASTIRVEACLQAAMPYVFGVLLSDDYSPPSNIHALMENRYSKYKTQTTTLGAAPLSVVCRYSASEYFGIKDVQDSSQVTPVTGNPTDPAYFVLFYADPTLTGDLGAVMFNVTIDFDCLFSESAPLDSS